MIKSKCCKAETKAMGIERKSGKTIVVCLECGKECHYYEDKNDLEQS